MCFATNKNRLLKFKSDHKGPGAAAHHTRGHVPATEHAPLGPARAPGPWPQPVRTSRTAARGAERRGPDGERDSPRAGVDGEGGRRNCVVSREGHACEAQGPRPPGGAGRRSPGWTGSVGGLEAGVGGGGYGSRRGWPPGSVGVRACLQTA